MKQKVSPFVAAGIAAVVLIIAAIFVWRGANSVPVAAANDKPIMPAGVEADFNQRLGGMKGAGGAPSTTGSGGGGGGAPIVPAGAPTGGAGYMAPPTGR